MWMSFETGRVIELTIESSRVMYRLIEGIHVLKMPITIYADSWAILGNYQGQVELETASGLKGCVKVYNVHLVGRSWSWKDRNKFLPYSCWSETNRKDVIEIIAVQFSSRSSRIPFEICENEWRRWWKCLMNVILRRTVEYVYKIIKLMIESLSFSSRLQ